MNSWRLVPARDLGLGFGSRFRSLRRESGWIESALHAGWWSFIRTYLGVCHRLRIVGREHLPVRAPFILVANHSSHLDALTLGAPLPWQLRERVFPLAAGDTFFERGPVAAFAALFLNALPMWRGRSDRHDLEELRSRLVGEPCGFILFPEGTRSRTGRMGRFQRGIGRLVAGTAVPVIPCHLRGPFEAAPPHSTFPRFRRITMIVGAPRSFESEENSREGWTRIAGALEAAVRRLAAEPRSDAAP